MRLGRDPRPDRRQKMNKIPTNFWNSASGKTLISSLHDSYWDALSSLSAIAEALQSAYLSQQQEENSLKQEHLRTLEAEFSERLAELDDETIDEVVKLIATANIEEVNVYNLLKAIKEKFPKVVEGFEDLI